MSTTFRAGGIAAGDQSRDDQEVLALGFMVCAEDLRVAPSRRNAVNQAGNGSALCVLVCGRHGECVLVRGPARAGGGAGPGRSDTSPRYRQKMDKQSYPSKAGGTAVRQ